MKVEQLKHLLKTVDKLSAGCECDTTESMVWLDSEKHTDTVCCVECGEVFIHNTLIPEYEYDILITADITASKRFKIKSVSAEFAQVEAMNQARELDFDDWELGELRIDGVESCHQLADDNLIIAANAAATEARRKDNE